MTWKRSSLGTLIVSTIALWIPSETAARPPADCPDRNDPRTIGIASPPLEKGGASSKGSVQDLDRMRGGKLDAPLAQNLLDLERAAGVGGRDQVRPRRKHVVRLAGADLVGARGLDQVVDARTAAALVALGDLQELEAGNAAQERPRLLANALRVREVAGIVVRHPQRDRVTGRRRADPGEKLRDVPDLRGKRGRPGGPVRIAGKQAGGGPQGPAAAQ